MKTLFVIIFLILFSFSAFTQDANWNYGTTFTQVNKLNSSYIREYNFMYITGRIKIVKLDGGSNVLGSDHNKIMMKILKYQNDDIKDVQLLFYRTYKGKFDKYVTCKYIDYDVYIKFVDSNITLIFNPETNNLINSNTFDNVSKKDFLKYITENKKLIILLNNNNFSLKTTINIKNSNTILEYLLSNNFKI